MEQKNEELRQEREEYKDLMLAGSEGIESKFTEMERNNMELLNIVQTLDQKLIENSPDEMQTKINDLESEIVEIRQQNSLLKTNTGTPPQPQAPSLIVIVNALRAEITQKNELLEELTKNAASLQT